MLKILLRRPSTISDYSGSQDQYYSYGLLGEKVSVGAIKTSCSQFSFRFRKVTELAARYVFRRSILLSSLTRGITNK